VQGIGSEKGIFPGFYPRERFDRLDIGNEAGAIRRSLQKIGTPSSLRSEWPRKGKVKSTDHDVPGMESEGRTTLGGGSRDRPWSGVWPLG
jgi:hypothetical protein